MDLLKVLMADGTKAILYLLVLVEIDISLIPEKQVLEMGIQRMTIIIED